VLPQSWRREIPRLHDYTDGNRGKPRQVQGHIAHAESHMLEGGSIVEREVSGPLPFPTKIDREGETIFQVTERGQEFYMGRSL